MIDANSQFLAILTNVGLAKQANADALGIPWKITEMGVGDANLTDPIPNPAQTKLINEWRRRPLNQLKVDAVDPAIIIAEQIIPADEGGRWIREIGLYDADGDLVAVANCAPSYKPLLSQGSGRTQVVRMNFIVNNSGNITLKIDPAVVLASRAYVDASVIEALGKLDFKHSALVATTVNIVLNGFQTIDGVALSADARVLVKNQIVPKDNGLYSVSAAGVWTRSADADSSLEVTPGLFVHVERGTTNGDSIWQLVTDAPIVLGVTDLLFEMAAGRTGINAGTYRSVTVDKYGRVVGGTSPTTIGGYSITDAYTKPEVDALIAQASSRSSTHLSIAAAAAGNSLNLTWNPQPLQFRNPTLKNGTPVSVTPAAPLSLVVPAGATLGTLANQQAMLILLVAYNAGVPVLCVANLAGGLDLSETGLISPTTISAGATSDGTIYSASAVAAGSPYRVVGCTQITEPTAGTWTLDPTLVQGIGGQTLAALQSLGYGQTEQNVTASRAFGTTYYNNTSRPILVSVSGNIQITATGFTALVNGAPVAACSGNSGLTISLTFMVRPGRSYSVGAGSVVSNTIWSEVR